MPPVIDPDKCRRCGTCADICNSHILHFVKDSGKVPVVRYPDECWHCDSCVLDCPAQAITLRIPLPFMLQFVDAASLREKEVQDAAHHTNH